ncbi:actin cortical patch protein [Grosmannia clavigera kw1407]|uniref:Actin cortical patch protein n=1 Tax=Grosmannia clavigera (strain kw1407 / UAMH 11150) TaxID=655863 RepID=F0XK64_GROCL|nr:actin cortical patch protein [Grosmannia clavigera kw1407]EFX02005.1 actin cortical patch protein [Grosmannia clavigera kw1407]
MAPTPVLVRGKRKRTVSSKINHSATPTPPPTRRRVRRRSTPFDSRLPFEILERIFLLSENLNLARASPLLGFRLSSRGTLAELVVAAFGPTWEHIAQQTADDASDPVFQSAVIACPWAKTALLLDAQQLWLHRHGLAKYRHVLVDQEAWACLMAATQSQARLEALLRSHAVWNGCQGAEPVADDCLEPVPTADALWPRNIHTCFCLEQAVFMHRICPKLSQWQPPSVPESSSDALPVARVDVHRLTRIPEDLLLAGGPYKNADGCHEAEAVMRQRLGDVVDKLFWLAGGGARLQVADSWEVTHLGVKYLMQIDVGVQEDVNASYDSYDGSNGISSAAKTLGYSTDALVATVIGLFHSLGVFTWQWPSLVLEEASRGVRARAAPVMVRARTTLNRLVVIDPTLPVSVLRDLFDQGSPSKHPSRDTTAFWAIGWASNLTMAIGHASLGMVSAIFLAGSIVMLFFVILGGVKDRTPLNHTYFLQADTSGIAGAKDLSQWTYFHICGTHNQNCGKAHPAMPFGAAWASHATDAPSRLNGKYGGHTTSYFYFYMWRFGWVFYLIALFFEIVAFFSSFLACCGRLGAGIGSLVSITALFFLTIAVSLMTATFVKARNVFHADNRSAHLGKYAFGFSWAALAALFISVVLLCIGTASRKRSDTPATGPNGNAGAPAKTRRGWRGRRGSKRSAGRTNGSFSKANYEDSRLDGSSV